MRTNIIKQALVRNMRIWCWGLCGLLLGAWTTAPEPAADDDKPKVKKEVRRDFVSKNNRLSLKKQTETEFDIYGKIVQFAEYEPDPVQTTALVQLTVNKYNPEGKRIGTMVYDPNNALLSSEELVLDDEGRIVKNTQINYRKTPAQRTYTTFEYDEYGNEAVTKTFATNDEQTSEKRRVFRESGELVDLTHWYYVVDSEKKNVKRTVHTINEFNQQGHLVKSVSEIQEGKRKWREIRHFENCALVECTKYENGKLVNRFEVQRRDTSSNSPAYDVPAPTPYVPFPMEYDDSKRDVLAAYDYTEMRTITLKTDKNNNVIKKVVREANQVYSVTYYFYDEISNLLTKERTIFKESDQSAEKQFTYDQYGNLVKESFFENDVLIGEQAVEYEYYLN